MYTVYWDFFWAAVLYTIAASGGYVAKEIDSMGGLILTLPIIIFTTAGASMFTLSAILRGVHLYG